MHYCTLVQCNMHCTVQHALYSSTCTVQCNKNCTVQHALFSARAVQHSSAPNIPSRGLGPWSHGCATFSATQHCSHCSLDCTLCTVQCTLQFTVHCTGLKCFTTVQCTVKCTMYRTLYIVYCTLFYCVLGAAVASHATFYGSAFGNSICVC